MSRNSLLGALACACGLASALHAQNIFVLPGTGASGTLVQTFSQNPFASITNFNAGANGFLVLARPDGGQYYVISNSGSATITAVSSTFQNPTPIANLNLQATAAAITPDGRHLLVVAGTLYVFDTSNNSQISVSGLNSSFTYTDVAVSLDGGLAYVLGVSPQGGSTLYEVNLNSLGVLGNLPVPGIATAVAVGPNDLVYVSTQNQILEINPFSFLPTPASPIPLNALPGKLVFTPDGKYALAPNGTPVTGGSVLLIDLTAHRASFVPPSIPVTFNQLVVANSNLVYAYSSQTESLYQITVTPAALNPVSVSNGPANGAITAVGVSPEIAAGAINTASYLYVVSNGILYRYDLNAGALSGQQTLPAALQQATAVSVAGPAVSGAAPATLLVYGNNQNLQSGATSLPLVVRVLDGQGHPINGVPVTFSNSSIGLNSTVTTGANGFALITATAPNTTGQLIITATAGSQSASFTVNVGTTPTGGSTAGLSIVAGQGQLVYQNQQTGLANNGSPLIVQVNDVNGNPLPNVPVTFTILNNGIGAITNCLPPSCTPLTTGNGVTINTGDGISTGTLGQASAGFLSGDIGPVPFVQTQIQASAPNTNSVTFYLTTYGYIPGTTQNWTPTVYYSPAPPGPLSGQAGTVQNGAVKVAVASGAGTPIPFVSVRALPASTLANQPGGACVDPTGAGILTDATGTATCNFQFNGNLGTGQVVFNAGYFNTSQPYTVNVTTGPPAVVKILQGNNQSGSPGQKLPLAFLIQITDAFGNVLSGVPVTFQVVTPNSISLSNVSSVTDSSGRASALGTLGSLAGTYQVQVTPGTGTGSAVFSFMVNIPASAISVVSGNNQTAQLGAAFSAPLVVKVVNASGSPVAGLQVTFTVSSGVATIASPTVVTDSNGQASTLVTAGSTPGPIVITASAAGLSTSFSLAVLTPVPTVTFLNAASLQPGISPGSLAVLQGAGLASNVQGVVTPFLVTGPPPATLAGVSVSFNGTPAPILSVSNVNGTQQIVLQVPFETTGSSSAAVTITTSTGQTFTINNVPLQPEAPGIFETFYNNQDFAVAWRQNGSYITPGNPAHLGDTICFLATGLGQTTPSSATGAVGIAGQNISLPLAMGINNAGTQLVSATTQPGVVGVDQICMQIPTNTATGPRQPVGLIVHDPTGDFYAQGSYIPLQ